MKTLTLITVGLLSVCGTLSGAAPTADQKNFLGLWQGVDPLDGGIITLEISQDADADDVLDLRFSDTFLRACTVPPIANLPEGETVDNRRGIVLGYASAKGNSLVSTGKFPGAGRITAGVQDVPGGATDPTLSPSGSTLVQVPVFCYKASAPDKPFFSVRAFWKLQRMNDILLLTGTLFTDDPSTPTVVETADGPNSMRFRRINRPE